MRISVGDLIGFNGQPASRVDNIEDGVITVETGQSGLSDDVWLHAIPDDNEESGYRVLEDGEHIGFRG